jgi:hypothetical protein
MSLFARLRCFFLYHHFKQVPHLQPWCGECACGARWDFVTHTPLARRRKPEEGR